MSTEKQEQAKTNISRQQEIIKIREIINKMEIEKLQINETNVL
jgi:hypothetical protein